MSAKQILIIDDEKNLCTVIAASLEKIGGWQVLTALSGVEGLRKAETQQPDAILLDVMMPDIDGLALFEKLQSLRATQTIPIILLTAKAQKVDIERFTKLGVAGVIAKPFDPLKLSSEIGNILKWI
ncbi:MULTISPECIES: response regulator [Nostocales]|uniref:Chemotaxis protein CheY n=3 Tax=Nostocales TaxID=1161 RepID=A0A0C1RIM8_9CYAN|nr:response regulator [Tolypothrix bouteillei]KAF3884710.1 response regulator [Tolypothrix bouteillei VB521301]